MQVVGKEDDMLTVIYPILAAILGGVIIIT